MVARRVRELHRHVLAAVETRVGIHDHVAPEADVIPLEERRQRRRLVRVEHDEHLPRPLEVAIERRELLGQVVLRRAGDHQHRRARPGTSPLRSDTGTTS
jgi:hypothetical protein